jgi:hypothetical protein
MSLQCRRMATVVAEYCDLVDSFNGFGHESSWVLHMNKLLPRLHVAVIALVTSSDDCSLYRFPDDDQRCELYLKLHDLLECDPDLKRVYGDSRLWHQSCDRLADDLSDIYFDLKQGLALLEDDPLQAANLWRCSFYVHWGKHLLDAECRLYAVETGGQPLLLPDWGWPDWAIATS